MPELCLSEKDERTKVGLFLSLHGGQRYSRSTAGRKLWGFIKAIANSRWILCKWFTLTAGDFGKGGETVKGNGK